MNNNIFISVILLAFASLTIKAADPVRYELDVKEFHELSVIEGINVDYINDPSQAGKAVFTTTPDLASVLMFSNEKGKLEMQIATDGIDYKGLPTVTVYSTYLTKASNAGDSTVRVLSVNPGPKFSAVLIGNGRLVVRGLETTDADISLKTGNGTLVADGKTERLRIGFSGTGTIQADGLTAKDIKVRASGTGAIGCNPSASLNIFGMGSTTIYYKGHPEIKNRSLGLKLSPIDQ